MTHLGRIETQQQGHADGRKEYAGRAQDEIRHVQSVGRGVARQKGHHGIGHGEEQAQPHQEAGKPDPHGGIRVREPRRSPRGQGECQHGHDQVDADHGEAEDPVKSPSAWRSPVRI